VIVGLPQLQRTLRPDELLLEIRAGSAVFASAGNRPALDHAFRLPPQGEVEALIADYLASINTPDKNRTPDNDSESCLLGPVWNWPHRRLIVVGHGALQALPFDALVTPDGTTSPKHTSSHRRPHRQSYVTSARAMNSARRRACWG